MTVVLGYWEIRGLAHPIRLLLEYTGTKWTENLYRACPDNPTWERFEHGKTCSRSGCWFADKHRNEYGLEFPNIPYFVDGDVHMSQSIAILKHIGEKNNLNGRNANERAHVDMLLSQTMDWKITNVKLVYSQWYDPTTANKWDELLAAYKNTDLPPILQSFSTFLGNKKWLLGDQISVADFLFWENLDMHTMMTPDHVKTHQNLVDYHQRFLAIAPISKYQANVNYKTRFNAPMAKWGNE